jgi:hypothetical protein
MVQYPYGYGYDDPWMDMFVSRTRQAALHVGVCSGMGHVVVVMVVMGVEVEGG